MIISVDDWRVEPFTVTMYVPALNVVVGNATVLYPAEQETKRGSLIKRPLKSVMVTVMLSGVAQEYPKVVAPFVGFGNKANFDLFSETVGVLVKLQFA